MLYDSNISLLDLKKFDVFKSTKFDVKVTIISIESTLLLQLMLSLV